MASFLRPCHFIFAIGCLMRTSPCASQTDYQQSMPSIVRENLTQLCQESNLASFLDIESPLIQSREELTLLSKKYTGLEEFEGSRLIEEINKRSKTKITVPTFRNLLSFMILQHPKFNVRFNLFKEAYKDLDKFNSQLNSFSLYETLKSTSQRPQQTEKYPVAALGSASPLFLLAQDVLINRAKVVSDIHSAPEAADALKYMIDSMNPKVSSANSQYRGQIISQTDLVIKVLSNPNHQIALSRYSILLLSYIGQKELPERSNFFADLKNVYTDMGYGAQEAEELTWEIVGLFGTRGIGVEIFFDLVGRKNILTVMAMKLAFSAAQVIDSLAWGKYQRSYLLPANIAVPCAFGRSYYFWMAAYLARDARVHGFDISSSANASFISASIYHFVNAKSPGKSLKLNFESPQYSLFHNVRRLSMTYAAAGAGWGVFNSLPGQIDLYPAYEAMLKNSKPINLSWLAKSRQMLVAYTANDYKEWLKLTAYDSALDNLLSQWAK